MRICLDGSKVASAALIALAAACSAGLDTGSGPDTRTDTDPAGEGIGALPPAGASRCAVDVATGDIACTHQALTIDGREVLYQTPLGTPPTEGWPVVIVFQGSLFAPERMWSATHDDPLAGFGIVTQTMLIRRLLDAGFAVVTPPADAGGTAWDTNIPPWLFFWQASPDHRFLLELFAAIEGGELGTLSSSSWYATGVSSGGYMTSRMAVSYPGRFLALAVVSASYATCGGPACFVPALPEDHPPTLFLHGGSDFVVAASTMYPYRDKLAGMGIPTHSVVDPAFRHGWIPASPDEVVEWFQSW